MNPTINLGNFSIDGYKFAINANAVLGTRNAGKTFLGKYLAESLIDINIPLIVLDPVGRWGFMKEANPNNPVGRGFPVIVVGKDNADIDLSLDTIDDIILMALETRSSLIIDLYHKEIDDIKDELVAKICEKLYYENEKFGLRTLIVEESSDFLGQTSKKTIATTWLTKLIRYSGNFKLGVVLINQNAESLSKEALKLCKGMLLGIQNETNSIKTIRKWLSGAGVKNADEVSESLPNLNSGQFWVWGTYMESKTPTLTNIPIIKSNHPSREDIKSSDVFPAQELSSVIESMRNRTITQEETAFELDILPEFKAFQMPTGTILMPVAVDWARFIGTPTWYAMHFASQENFANGTVKSMIDNLVSKGYTKYNHLLINAGSLENKAGQIFNLNTKVECDYAKTLLYVLGY